MDEKSEYKTKTDDVNVYKETFIKGQIYNN
jgi:hypothetical protein